MRALAAALLLLSACSGGGGGAGDSAPPPPPPTAFVPASILVWGLSPFTPDCGGFGGTLYINSEVEPHLAVDPRDPNHLIGVWQQDRWSNGSSRGLLAGVSFDGGATWRASQAPFSTCSGGIAANGGGYVRATDPWIGISPDGTAHFISVSTSGGTFAAGSSNAVLVSRSMDGGRTWSNPATLIRDGASAFNDKETLTPDPRDSRFVYAVWDRIVQGGGGPTWFARTLDGGATWEPARAIFDPGPDQQTIGNLIRVLPDGTLVDVYARLRGDETSVGGAFLEVIRSQDHGATWSVPVRISDFRPLGARDPNTGREIRDGAIIPQMAVAPNGNLYVVWQDGRFSGERDGIALSRSTDGGLTWSAPARVNADPSVAAFTAQVHVRADGAVAVTYFDLRPDTPDTATLLVNYWMVRSSDGAVWSETQLDGPFDIATAPDAGGYFLGDYMGLASVGATFLSFYVRTTANPSNRNDVFMARIPATVTTAAKRAPFLDLDARGADFDSRSFAALQRARALRAMR